MTADPLLSTIRISTLIVCMAAAARSDYGTLHVRDTHWLWWAIPGTLILLFEVISNSDNFANMCMVFALVATFSSCFVRPSDPRRIMEWTRNETFIFLLYILAISGITLGIIENYDTNFIELILGEESPDRILWWSLLGALVTMGVYLTAWRFGVIQGGADVKALILVTLYFPSWGYLPDQMFHLDEDLVFGIPPSMALFVWAGAAFILAPPLIFINNIVMGNVESMSDLKMAWHATRKRLSEVENDNSWVLTELVDHENGPRVVNRILPSKKSSSSEYSNSGSRSTEMELLDGMGLETVWVARKHPFLVYLFLGIFPLVFFGDPIAPLII